MMMSREIKIRSFEDWVNHVFNHPASKNWTADAWYWKLNAPYWNANDHPKAAVAYLTHLFRDAPKALHSFSDAQINQGLWYLIFPGEYYFVLENARVPLAERLTCIQAMPNLFESIFARRCSNTLSHLSEEAQNPLNSICYMWWDIFQIPTTKNIENFEEISEAILDVLEKELYLNFDACREGALHGLGHWHGMPRKRVMEIIDQFLRTQPEIRPELRQYAQNARNGAVQ
jgi:hypothetical protein